MRLAESVFFLREDAEFRREDDSQHFLLYESTEGKLLPTGFYSAAFKLLQSFNDGFRSRHSSGSFLATG